MSRGYNNDPRRLVRIRRLKHGPRPPVDRRPPGAPRKPPRPPAPPPGKRREGQAGLRPHRADPVAPASFASRAAGAAQEMGSG